MRRLSALLAVAALSLFLGAGPVHAQSATTLPLPAGQGGPDNGVNAVQGGDAPGGRTNPAADAGPAVSDDDGSIAPWLIGAAVLVLLVAGAAVVVRRAANNREPSYSR